MWPLLSFTENTEKIHTNVQFIVGASNESESRDES